MIGYKSVPCIVCNKRGLIFEDEVEVECRGEGWASGRRNEG